MIRLTTKQVIYLHSSLIEATGGADGVTHTLAAQTAV